MPQFYTLLTDTGQAKLANAVALGGTIEITELAVGDGGGSLPTPDSSATALINEVRRAPINASDTDPDNPSWIVVEQVLPPDVGGWTIREIGIYDIDGDLIGIGNYPETYKPVLAEGSSRTQTVRFVLEVSDTAAVTLKVDPSVVLATREYVDNERTAHEASRNHPPATQSAQGMVELATQTETNAGTDSTRPVTPATLAGRTATESRTGVAEIATQTETDAGTDDGRFITPKKLKNWVKQATESVMGLLKVATQDQVDSGTDDTAAVTPKKLLGGAAYVAASAGYLVLPSWLGAIKIQWLRASTSTDVAGNDSVLIPFTWPVAFDSSIYVAVSNLSATGYGAKGGNTYCRSLELTSGDLNAFNDGNSTWNSASAYIIAIGK